MADISEIAVAAWRLEKWLDNVNVERKMAAKSALRAIKKYLQENNIEAIDLTGAKFDVGLAVSVVNNESDETDEDKLIIREMVKPIIKENGAVIQYGQVILGDEVKQPKANNVIDEAAQDSVVAAAVSIADEIEKPPVADESKEPAPVEPVAELTPPQKEKKNRIPLICIAALQVVTLVLLLLLGRNIVLLKQDAASLVSTKVIENNTVVDMSELEKNVSGLNDKLDGTQAEIDGRLLELDEKITSIASDLERMGLSVDDIADYVETQKEAQEAARREEEERREKYFEYEVKSGDSLYKICTENGIDYTKNIKEILELNGISDANLIIVGQKLILPKE